MEIHYGKNKTNNKENKENKKIKSKELPYVWQILEEIRDTMDKVSFDFTKSEYLQICDEAMLSDLQTKLLEDKIKGLTIVQMSLKHNVSTDVVVRNIRKIKSKILKII